MTEKDKIYICLIINSIEVSTENIEDWFSNFLYFKPSKMRGNILTNRKLRKYEHKKFIDGISKEIQIKDIMKLSVEDIDENKLTIIRGAYNKEITWLTCTLTQETYELNSVILFKSIDNFMQKHNGIVAYACSSKDNFWQNTESIENYQSYGRSTENISLIPSSHFPDDMIVDIEQNPGHYHIVNGVWFGSCWKMWYGSEYFKYIPKDVLASFQNCFENIELENEVINITLYENVWDYDQSENREVQIEFRNQTGIDIIAHELMLIEVEPTENDNTSIEINTGEFEHQGVRMITYYYDDKGEVVSKSSAVESRTYELDQKGKIVWSEIKKLTN